MEAVGGILRRVVRQMGLEPELQGWGVAEAWPHLVGARIARHTRCIGYRAGTLRVEVEGSAWMHELSYLEHELLRKVNRHLGTELVREVKFVIARGGILR